MSKNKDSKPAKGQEKERNERKESRGSKEGKKNTSLRLDAKTLKALKIRAIEEDTSVQSIMAGLIDMYLNNKVKLSKTLSKKK